jgi:cytochrome c oxidase subunit II
VRRRAFVLLLVIGAALGVASVAYAGNGGFAPPTPRSPNSARIDDTYKWISIFTVAIFIVVETTLIWFIFRYRHRGRPRTVEGAQVHGATRLELIWTAIPVLILAAIAGFIFYKLPGIKDVPSAKAENGPLKIDVDGYQFYWRFRYPNGAVSIDELRAPVNRTVEVEITSSDVVHSWWIPELHGKFDAVPGGINRTWFKASRIGTYRGQCGEFCGAYHAKMVARVKVTSREDYERWVSEGARRELGRSEWVNVCAKCHGLTGRGGYGPSIAQNQLLVQPQGLRSLLRLGQNQLGPKQSYMPAVGRRWTDEQFRALNAYLKQKIYKGGNGGG